jgi:hypothetical protein
LSRRSPRKDGTDERLHDGTLYEINTLVDAGPVWLLDLGTKGLRNLAAGEDVRDEPL